MALSGKVSTELWIHSPAVKFFNFFTKQLHVFHNVAERIHQGKVLQGDWHGIGSVKHWTYVIDGKVVTCKERIEHVNEQNKSVTYVFFDGDVGKEFKVFKLNLQATDKDDGGAVAKWTVEYEKLNDDVPPPYGYMDCLTKITKDVDAYLLKA